MRKENLNMLVAVCFSLLVLAAPAARADITTGLIGHWKLDGNPSDSAGSHNGTVIGSLSWGAGIDGQAMQNSGAGSIMIIMTEPLTNVTHAMWFKTSTANGGLFQVNAAWDENDRHIYLNGGNVYTRIWDDETIQTSGLNLADGQWHHVAHAFGSSIGGQKIYVDGVERASGTKAASDFDWQTEMYIGYSEESTPDFRLIGSIDDFRIYNRVLGLEDLITLAGGKASNPNPVSGSGDVSVEADLRWTAGLGAISHDVYLDTVNPPVNLEADDYSGTTLDPNTLEYNRTYYWRADKNTVSGTIGGVVWSFTTNDGKATVPGPVDGANDVSVEADLSWTEGEGAISGDVYLDTVNPPVNLFVEDYSGTTLDVNTLDYNTTYYWQVDENYTGGTNPGDVWSFTTDDGKATAPDPCDGEDGVSIKPDLSWTAGEGALSHDIYLGTDAGAMGLLAQEHPVNSIAAGELELDTIYYWQVVENTVMGSNIGDIWSFRTFPLTGSGTEEEPYLIDSFEHLEFLSEHSGYWDPNIYFELTVDISMQPGVTIDPIGNESTPFEGVFDGGGHSLSSFYQSGTGYLGLFGATSASAWISNLSIAGASIKGTGNYNGILVGYNEGQISDCSVVGAVTGYQKLGGLVGYNSGDISQCSATGVVIGGDNSSYLVGGLVGENDGGTISHSSATGAVSGNSAGGLVGYNDNDGAISHCYATGTVNGSSAGGLVGVNSRATISYCSATGVVTGGDNSSCLGGLVGANNGDGAIISHCSATGPVTGGNNSNYLGGLAGYNQYDAIISNCYCTGAVTGTETIGGLSGYNQMATITYSYSAGAVSGTSYLGGLVGWNSLEPVIISNCYWDITSSGRSNGVGSPSPDPNGVTGKTSAEMKQQATFIDWDFTDTWLIAESKSYPYQDITAGVTPPIPGDVNGDGVVDFKDVAILCNNWLAGFE